MTLERFDVTESHAPLGSDVARLAHAAYAAELVGKLCAPRQVEANVYDWLTAFLDHLESGGASAERLRVFELGLLAGLGLGPVIEGCAVCGGLATRDATLLPSPSAGIQIAAARSASRARAAAVLSHRRSALPWSCWRRHRSPPPPTRRSPRTSTATAARRSSRSSATTSAAR